MLEVDFTTNVTPLYDAIGKCNWDAASLACRRNPMEAKTWVVRRRQRGKEQGSGDDNTNNPVSNILWRILPLHSACARNPPSSFVSQLLSAYPDAASLVDNNGMHPLHYACGNRASREVIQMLIESFPQAIREADPQQGMLPLHYIAQWGPSEDGIVEMLLDAHAEGVVALSGEGMSPLDLCREANYEDWEKVLSVLEESTFAKRQSSSDGGGGEDDLGGKHLSVPRNIEEKQADSLLSSTIEVRRKIVPSPLTISHRDRNSPSKHMMNSSTHGTKFVEASTQYDARDEVSTPRSHHNNDRGATTPRSYQSILAARTRGSLRTQSSSHSIAPHSIISSVPSPRYHDMKTPRSSGRGPGFSFGSSSNTPSNSSRSSNSLGINFERESCTRGQKNDVCGERTASFALKSNPPSLASSMSQLSFRFEGDCTRPSLTVENGSSLDKKERQDRYQQILNHTPQDRTGPSFRSSEEQQSSFATIQAENAQLRATLMDYLTIQSENRQLQAQLANYHAVFHENQELHAKLAKLQDIQNEFSEIVNLLQRRESLRVSVSSNRKKFLLEMLAAEDNLNQEEQSGLLYRGETLPMAIGRQIANIGQLRNMRWDIDDGKGL